MRRILPTITEKRLAFLRLLERQGIASRNSRVGYDTMNLKWTQWAYTNGIETISAADFDWQFPAGDHAVDDDPRWKARAEAWNTWRKCGETLTDAGRAILEQHKTVT